MSSDVMPIEPEPPPEPSPVPSIFNLSRANYDLLIRPEHRKYYNKVTKALHDTGADDCTTDDPYVIFNLQLLPNHLWINLYDAGRNVHHSKFGGFSFLRMRDGSMKKFLMRYTPSMRITAIDISKLRDPTMICLREGELIDHKNQLYSYVWSYDNDVTHVLPLVQFGHEERRIERYYTGALLKVDEATASRYNKLLNSGSSVSPTIDSTFVPTDNPPLHRQVQVRQRLPVEASRILWHHRLMHMNDNVLVKCHEAVDGIPPIKPSLSIDKCHGCMHGKLKKASHKKEVKPGTYDHPSVRFLQHVHCDYGFMVQRSKNESRYRRLCAHNGDSCYLAIQCMKHGYVLGITSNSKEAPMKWLHYILTKFAFKN